MKYRVWVFSSMHRKFVALHECTSKVDAEHFRFQWQMRHMCTAVEKVKYSWRPLGVPA